MNKKKRLIIIKYFLYTLMLFVLYTIQTTPGLFSIGAVKPFLILPAVVCIAMYEREYAGGLLGALGGMLCDLSSNSYFGFYGIMLLLIGTVIGLLCEYLVQRSLYSAYIQSCVGYLIVSGLVYFFQYGLWGYVGAGSLWINQILPSGLLTLPFVFIIHHAVLKIHMFFVRYADT